MKLGGESRQQAGNGAISIPDGSCPLQTSPCQQGNDIHNFRSIIVEELGLNLKE